MHMRGLKFGHGNCHQFLQGRCLRGDSCAFAHVVDDEVEPSDRAHPLTVILTTSPVRSNPSTSMIADTLAALDQVPLLRSAPKILVCDGICKAAPGKPSNHKAGRVSAEEAERYAELIERVQRAAASDDGPFAGVRVLALGQRAGFGFAVRRALVEVRTRFVMVVQHDQVVVRPFDLTGVLRAMEEHPEVVKYVCLVSEASQHYASTARGRYGLELKRTREYGVPLLPIAFWYDKPHVTTAQHYREVRAASRTAPVRRIVAATSIAAPVSLQTLRRRGAGCVRRALALRAQRRAGPAARRRRAGRHRAPRQLRRGDVRPVT
jgi:hypothetical protein